MIDTVPGALRTTVFCLATAVSLGGCGSLPDHLDADDALMHEAMQGMRLNIPAGTAVRFEPGQTREVELVELAGLRRVFGFAGRVMGNLD